MTVRNLAELVFRPRYDGAVVMTVERAIVEPLRLQEDHRIGILDRRNQQSFGVARVRRHDRLQTCHMGEQSLRALAVGLSA